MAIGDIEPMQWNYGVIALSYIISVFGSWVALTLANQTVIAIKLHRRWPYLWLFLAAIAEGGIGIWAMHAIGLFELLLLYLLLMLLLLIMLLLLNLLLLLLMMLLLYLLLLLFSLLFL